MASHCPPSPPDCEMMVGVTTEPSVSAVLHGMTVFVGNFSNRVEAVELDEFAPSDPSHFGLELLVYIGPSTVVSDRFDLTVCSPSWWKQWVHDRWTDDNDDRRYEPVVSWAGIWFMSRWDKAEFERALEKVCSEASPGPDWGTVASRLSRSLLWEYDYHYDAFVNKHPGESYPPPYPEPDEDPAAKHMAWLTSLVNELHDPNISPLKARFNRRLLERHGFHVDDQDGGPSSGI
jgi:hypothetical protein